MERTKQTKRKKDTKGGSENKKIKKEEKQKKLSFDPLEVRKYGRFKYYDIQPEEPIDSELGTVTWEKAVKICKEIGELEEQIKHGGLIFKFNVNKVI